VGTIDELKDLYGDDFFDRRTRTTVTPSNWQTVCVCGHLSRNHATVTGGDYRVPENGTQMSRGVKWATVTAFEGCVGALRPTGFEEETIVADREHLVVTRTVHPTCPCVRYQPVAKVDRPNRYFNQRVPADRKDPSRHPMLIGLKAFRTHLSRRRAALADPTWPDREFAQRFLWLDGARVCGLSKCRVTDGVFPIYVDGSRSDLRCPKHR
jgi:hypothetical protein